MSNFFITQLIWSITLGSYHLPFSFLLLFLLLKLWDHLSWLKALALSLFFSIGTFAIFFSIVWLVIVWGFHFSYILPEDTYHHSHDYLNTSLLLAFIYIFLETLQLSLLRKWMKINFWRMFLCILFANVMSALLVYKMTFTL